MCVRNKRQHFAALIGSAVNPYDIEMSVVSNQMSDYC